MKKYNIEKVMVTKIRIMRDRLITKEKMENFCIGKEDEKLSVNDDLEILFENIQIGEEPDEFVNTYFLPRLTEHEININENQKSILFSLFFFSLFYENGHSDS